MPSSYTTNLRFTQQADGENPSTWGDIENSNHSLYEQAICGLATQVLTSGTFTLTTNNGASDQARCMFLSLSGTMSGNCTVVVPNLSKLYIVYNGTSGAFTVTVATSAPVASVTVPQGGSALVWCDGNNNTFTPATTSLNGIAGTNYARLDATTNQWQSTQNVKEQAVAYAATINLNLTLGGDIFYTTLTGNTTLGAPSASPAATYDKPFLYFITQDATGGRTVAFTSNWLQSTGSPPVIDLTANSTTVLSCVYSSTLGKIVVLQGYTGYNGVITAGALTLDKNEFNVQVYQRVGSPGAAANVTVTINPGVKIVASDTSSPALDLSGFAAGSVINVILGTNSYILGRGGDGGPGGSTATGTNYQSDAEGGTPGRPGGVALNGPGSASTVNVTFASTCGIFGGGGGGGGGGATAPSSTSASSNGGGGGGGAGGSKGGVPGHASVSSSATYGSFGGDGGWAASGAAGSGGAAGGGAFPGSAGGAGGDWGTAGTAGTNGTAGANGIFTSGGAAGAAGKAINLNSGSFPGVSSNSPAGKVKGTVS